MAQLLQEELVLTSEEKMQAAAKQDKVNPRDFSTMEFLFPESIKDFQQFEVQYKVQ